jgi:hypothetical protein
MKERQLSFGYKKSVPFISTSCAPHCEKSQLEGRWQTARVIPGISCAGMRTKRGLTMKRLHSTIGVFLLLLAAPSTPASARDAFGAWTDGLPAGWVEQASCDPYVDYGCVANNRMVTAAKAAATASGYCDPYVNYKCLDAYLGDNFFTRFYRYYELEWGKGVAPADPHAPAASRSDAAWPPTPQSLSADAVRRMAVWRHAEYRQNVAELGGFAADGRAWQYPARQCHERRPCPSLWLDQWRRQFKHE